MTTRRSPSMAPAPSAAPAAAPTSASAGSAIERAFVVLQTVVSADGPVGVRELARRTGLPRSTVSRLVATLEGIAMVTRTSGGQVTVGSALATLHAGPGVVPPIADQLRPLLIELVERFGEHAALATDGGDSVLYLAQVTADQPVSAPEVSGQRHPFHVVAPGLVEMAWWADGRLRDHLAAPLAAATEHSVTDPDAITDRLETVRADGYVWTDQELDAGVNGLAAPVLAGDGSVLATVSLYGPSYRFNPIDRPTLGDDLRDLVAVRAAALLGW